MSRSRTSDWKLLPLIGGLLAVAAIGLAPAQAKRGHAVSAPSKTRRKAQTQPPLQFGDITIRNAQQIHLTLGVQADAVGPDTTVDWNDPKTGEKGTLKSPHVSAFILKGSNNQVEHIEANDGVHFEGSQPAPGGGTQTTRVTGSKGFYYKQEQHLILQGPVSYFAEGPASDGKSKQSVTGTSDSANYDGIKQVMTLTGSVKATLVDPVHLQTPAEVNGDEVQIELSAKPYKLDIRNHAPGGKLKFRPLTPEKPGKKPS